MGSRHHSGETLEAQRGHLVQQRALVGEMPIRRGVRHSQLQRELLERQPLDHHLRDRLDRVGLALDDDHLVFLMLERAQ
ncbi:MAG: hypothetical protein ABW321_10255, partial [Polyangiales bacterium]